MSGSRFAGWNRVKTSYGAIISDPRGHDHGLVRVRRRRAREPMAAIIEGARRRSPEMRSAAVDLRRLVTAGGDHAAIATLRANGRADRLLGVILGEAAMVHFEGVCEVAGAAGAFALAFADLVRQCSSGDDPDRRRMFEYRPPPSWRGLRRSTSTLWLPPTCPADPARLEVFDAISVADPGARLTRELFAPAPAGTAAPLATRALTGQLSPGPDVWVARLSDDRFTYEVRLSPGGEHVAVAEALVATIEPIPRSGPTDGPAGVFEWIS